MRSNLLAVYLAYFVRYAVPLATLPFLARMLGLDAFGRVAMVEAVALAIMIVVEFGFGMSMVRELSRLRTEPRAAGTIIGQTFGAQAVLTLIALGGAWLVGGLAPALRADPRLYGCGVIAGLLQGWSPVWYLRGSERLQLEAALDMVARCLRAALIFTFVRGPEDAWIAPASTACAEALRGGILLFQMRSVLRDALPAMRLWRSGLRVGVAAFGSRLANAAFAGGTSLVLGLMASPSAAGLFGSSDRLITALRLGLNTALDAIYPRMARLLAEDPLEAARVFRVYAGRLIAAAACVGVTLALCAPWVVPLVLGPQFTAAVPVMRLQALALPLLSLNAALGGTWLYLRGDERRYVRVLSTGGVCNLALTALACELVPAHAQIGAAAAYLSCQLAIAAALSAIVVRSRPAKSVALELN